MRFCRHLVVRFEAQRVIEGGLPESWIPTENGNVAFIKALREYKVNKIKWRLMTYKIWDTFFECFQVTGDTNEYGIYHWVALAQRKMLCTDHPRTMIAANEVPSIGANITKLLYKFINI